MNDQPSAELVAAAVAAARRSTCAKSRRGAAIQTSSWLGLWAESNGPPSPFRCNGSLQCRTFCRRLAVHAEQRVLLTCHEDMTGGDLLHVKVVDGEPVASGAPSCSECSKLILEAGIGRVWLLRSVGWRAYGAVEFHGLSLQHHNLPRIL